MGRDHWDDDFNNIPCPEYCGCFQLSAFRDDSTFVWGGDDSVVFSGFRNEPNLCLYDVPLRFPNISENVYELDYTRTYCSLENQFKYTNVWSAPALNLIADNWVVGIASDQEDGWYMLLQHDDDVDICNDPEFSFEFTRATMTGVAEDIFLIPENSTKVSCERVDVDWCLIDATNQMTAKQGDILFGTTIGPKDEFATKLYLALSDQHGETCSARWEKVCKEHNTIEQICKKAYNPPFKCERTISLGPLTVLSLSFSAMQLVMSVLFFAFAFLLGRLCNSSSTDDDDDAAARKKSEDVELSPKGGDGRTETVVAGDGGNGQTIAN